MAEDDVGRLFRRWSVFDIFFDKRRSNGNFGGRTVKIRAMLGVGRRLPSCRSGAVQSGEIMEGTMHSRAKPMTWIAVAILGVLGGALGAGAAAAETPAEFSYRVTHSVLGEIGNYTNIIEPSRDGTTVQTRAHFEVKMLGVKMYHEDAERTEHWQGNRLVSFRGVTDKGQGPAEVKGEARGNNFVITSPEGTVTAPWSVHPANPWSSNFLHSNTMMRPDSGKLEQVRVGPGEETTVKLDGAAIPAVKYEVDGTTKYTVWLDSRGVPVQFVVDDNTGKVTFTLAKCSGCNPVVSQLK
jgi:Family of unknown function (DUF6134)